MEALTYTVRYFEDGSSIAEDFVSAIGALGRIGALIDNGIGNQFSLFCGDALLMAQDEIFDSLKITRH